VDQRWWCYPERLAALDEKNERLLKMTVAQKVVRLKNSIRSLSLRNLRELAFYAKARKLSEK
jgi:hypothetical protein